MAGIYSCEYGGIEYDYEIKNDYLSGDPFAIIKPVRRVDDTRVMDMPCHIDGIPVKCVAPSVKTEPALKAQIEKVRLCPT